MRRVRWSEDAQADYAEILRFAAERDSGYAERLETRILATAALLAERPIGRPSQVEGVSQKLVLKTSFLIAYRVDGVELTILRVIHGSRDWPAEGWPAD